MNTERTHSTYSEKTTVWAHFGYAIMKCQVLEHRLADVLFMCEMLNGKFSWSDQEHRVPGYQRQTLGWLKNRLTEARTLPPTLAQKLQEACDIRNELAHRYFKPRMDALHTREGYAKLVSEIERMYGTIEDVIAAFHRINILRGKPLGYSDEDIERVQRAYYDYFERLPEQKKTDIIKWNERHRADRQCA